MTDAALAHRKVSHTSTHMASDRRSKKSEITRSERECTKKKERKKKEMKAKTHRSRFVFTHGLKVGESHGAQLVREAER